jgi:streptogramin lyase
MKPKCMTNRLSMIDASLRAFFVLGLLLAAPAVCPAQVTITEYPVPTGGQPQFITAAPDGNLWFTKSSPHDVGKITPAGVVTAEFPTGNNPTQITVGPDGNLWFAEEYGNNIGRITTAGVLTEFPVPTSGCHPAGITSGPDGNLWFTEAYADKIGKITPTGVITEFPVGRVPVSITAGPDGNLWFTECACATSGNPAKIGRITTAGVINEYSVPTLGSSPYSITAGPDGNLWFTEYTGNRIGRITTAGAVTEFPIPTSPSLPIGITVGPDGNLWFADDLAKIGKIILTVPMSEFSIHTLIADEPRFYEQGSFRQGAGSKGINPVTSAVTFTFGTASIVIPPGSFRRLGSSNIFLFIGIISGVSMAVDIQAQNLNATEFNFGIVGMGLDLASQVEPMEVGLQIGDNIGSATFNATVFP